MLAAEYKTLRAVEDVHWWYAVLRGLVVRELRAQVRRDGRVLDAGCGTGGMMQRLQRWRAAGIDAAEAAVAYCRLRGLHRVRCGHVERLPWSDGSFDAVLSLDVLYHADVDEAAAWSEMVRVLRPGGLIVVNVPALECLRGGHDVAVCGARRYTANHVRQALEFHSLEVMSLHYWNAWLFLPLLLRRQWHRSATSDLSVPPPWLNAALAWAGEMDARVCRALRVPFGSSVFAVARKRA